MPSAYVLSEALAAAEQELALQWMPLFFDSEAYRERQEKRRALLERPPTVQMGDERLATAARDGVGSFSEALATQQQALRVSDSQRLSQMLRKQPEATRQFEHYLSTGVPDGSPLLPNDLRFWLEVQRFKGICHVQGSKALVKDKLTAVIKCFFNSEIAPKVQVDVPPQVAKSVCEKGRQRNPSPYAFRAAEEAVFQALLACYPGFCEYRRKMRRSLAHTVGQRALPRR
eukprot:m.409440 g.409440  ORF g.409440 m.409440 type:complete len:229 (-) comp20155_c2_seq6:1765-2451(-)